MALNLTTTNNVVLKNSELSIASIGIVLKDATTTVVNNADYAVEVAYFTGSTLNTIPSALAADAGSITFSDDTALVTNEYLITISHANKGNTRLFFNAAQEFQSNAADFDYAPSNGPSTVKVESFGDFAIPDTNTGLSVYGADVNHLKGSTATLTLPKKYLFKATNKKYILNLSVPATINSTDFGYEVVLNEIRS